MKINVKTYTINYSGDMPTRNVPGYITYIITNEKLYIYISLLFSSLLIHGVVPDTI